MGEPSFDIPPAEKPPDPCLDSWKEIASYLNRDVTTVQRWEKREGMPVHRHLHSKRGSVYALARELDDWIRSRKPPAPEAAKPREPEPLAAATSRHPFRLWLALAIALGLCLALVSRFALRRRAAPAPAPGIRSLAVLPLRNLSGDPTQDYLADGITEALIGRLSNIHNLRVPSHTSVMRFKNPQASVPEIARTLGVDAVVEGSVIKDGDRIRVSAQLIRAATDEHFWSVTYDRQMRDALTLESDLAQSIAAEVEVTVTGEEQRRLRSARPVAPEVYESYLQGAFALNRGNKAAVDQSLRYFQDAIDKDPAFAPAYLGLAQAYTVLGTVFAGDPPQATRPRVLAFARKALSLDPDLGEAHVVLANTLQEEWQWAQAEAEYQRALQLNPNNAIAHAEYALWLSCQGRTDEAIVRIQHARALDPIGVSGASVSWILFQAHRFDEAVRESRSALATQPDNAGLLLNLGFLLLADDRPQEAVAALEKALTLSPGSPAVTGVLIRAYAHAGRRADALRLLANLHRRRKTGYIPAAAFVNAYLGLGDTEQAFFWLEQAYKEQSNILQFLKTHPFFDPIRNDPRFFHLVHRVGLN